MFAQIVSLITPAFALLFACLFGHLWAKNRDRVHILAMALGYACFVVSFCVVILWFDASSPMIVVLVNIIATGGAASIVWGAARRLEQPVPKSAFLAIALASSVLVWLAVLAKTPMVLMIAQNGASSLIMALGALCVWHSGSRQALDRAMMWLLSLMALHGFTRPLQIMLIEGLPETLSFGATAFQAVNVVLMGLFSVGVAMVFLASLVRDDMEREREAATQDALTGLLLRGAFEERAHQLLARAQTERIPVSLLVGDIDHFKSVNDTWGHSAGDRVIAAFASNLTRKIRPGDVAGRVGGEEFCVLVWNCSEKGAASLGERLRMGFASETVEGLPNDRTFTASFGVAQWERGEEYMETFKRADAALYAAKRGGRNRVESASGVQQPGNSALGHSAYEDDQSSSVVPLRPVKSGS